MVSRSFAAISSNRAIQKLAIAIFLAGLAAWALISLGRWVSNTFSPALNLNPPYVDFHVYWFSGQFIRQQLNPYQAYLGDPALTHPVFFLDSGWQGGPLAQAGLGKNMIITPALMALTLPLSFLSWNGAKIAWFAINLGLLIWIPWLAVRLLPEKGKGLPGWQKASLFLSFIGLTATRSALSSGQISLLVFALMLIAMLLADKHPWLAGIALGFALSKYNLALPLALLFLIERRWRSLLAAAVLQLAGVSLLALWMRVSPLMVINQLIQQLVLISPETGIELTSLFSAGNAIGWIAVGLFALAIAASLAKWYFHHNRPLHLTPIERVDLLAVIALWMTLSVYHRTYDAIVYLLALAGLFYGLSRGGAFSPHAKLLLAGGFFIITAILMLPGNALFFSLSPEQVANWSHLVDSMITLSLFAATWLALLLLLRSRQDSNVETPPANP